MKEQEIHEMLPLPCSNNNVMITVCTVHMSILRVWDHLLCFNKRVDESQIQGLVANSLYMAQVGICRYHTGKGYVLQLDWPCREYMRTKKA